MYSVTGREVPSQSTESTGYALLACASCKARKTKCDKLLPACTVCTGKNWNCDYSAKRKVRTSHKGAKTSPGQLHMSSPDRSLVQQDPVIAKFPPAFFLDVGVFETLSLQIPKARILVPANVTNILGDTLSIQDTVSRYFQAVHNWMAILSKKKFYMQQLNPLTQPNEDVVLLLLSIKLILWVPSTAVEDPKTPLYAAVKSFHSDFLTMGVCSIQVLQAGILIALYEIGQCIYPAAYMSIGVCARYGAAFGFDASCSINPSGDMMDDEERKRAWWAITILDRVVSFGNPKRILATREPEMDSVLPIEDTAWNEGVLTQDTLYTLASPSSVSMGRFARLVQAAHLLGRVLRNVADNTLSKSFRTQEASQLYRTLSALANLAEVESKIKELEFCSQIAICYSGLLLLHQTHESIAREFSGLSEKKLNPREALPERAVLICREYLTKSNHTLDTVSPLLLPYIYHSALICHQKGNIEGFRILKQGLAQLNQRWRCAGAYIEILKAQEFIHAS